MVPFLLQRKKLFSGAIGRCPERTEEKRDESRLDRREMSGASLAFTRPGLRARLSGRWRSKRKGE
jgi:hypothetical protein